MLDLTLPMKLILVVMGFTSFLGIAIAISFIWSDIHEKYKEKRMK